MKPTPDISVIIATRNRADSLRDTLESLARQQTAGEWTFEVLVVDNGSTDHTRSVVEQMKDEFPVPLRYVYEEREGQAHALNTGMQQANGTFFAVTDDDAIPSPTWLLALWTCVVEERAEAVAGRVLPLWRADKPAWMTERLACEMGVLGCLDHGPRRLRGAYRWAGVNMAFHRDLVERVGGFNVRMLRAQDTEYFTRCLRAKAAMVYEPDALVYHKVGAERLSLRYFRYWHHLSGYYHAYLPPWHPSQLLTVMPGGWYQEVWWWVQRWVYTTTTRGPWAERFICELMLRDRFSQWIHRLAMWPRYAASVVTARPSLMGRITDLQLPARELKISSTPGLISAAVCTYNRCDSLRDTLRALSNQTLRDGLSLEILIVDNNSTDHTQQVVEEAAMESRWPIRYLFEPRQGKSFAGNMAIREARGEILAMTDDDAIPESTWAQALHEAFVSLQADCVGGMVLPFWLAPPPDWLLRRDVREALWTKLALLDRGPKPVVADGRNSAFIFGDNMAFRTDALVELGGFRTDLGPKGDFVMKCEDTEILERFFASSKRVVYAPHAIVYHKVPPRRMRMNYFRHWQFLWGRSMELLSPTKTVRVPRWYGWYAREECLGQGLKALQTYARRNPAQGLQEELVFWRNLGRLVQMRKARAHPAASPRGAQAAAAG